MQSRLPLKDSAELEQKQVSIDQELYYLIEV